MEVAPRYKLPTLLELIPPLTLLQLIYSFWVRGYDAYISL